MNALQLAPLSVTATPPGPVGKHPTGEAPSSDSKHSTADTKAAPRGHEARQQRLAEARANTARATAEREAQAEDAANGRSEPAAVDTFDRKVGLVEGTFKVFVDIVKPPEGEAVFRVFGPPEDTSSPPAGTPATTSTAANAYARAGNALPLKDLGVA